jgi:hypothetical protein
LIQIDVAALLRVGLGLFVGQMKTVPLAPSKKPISHGIHWEDAEPGDST